MDPSRAAHGTAEAPGSCVPGSIPARGTSGRARAGLPFGVVVNEDVVLHGELEVRNFLADPSEIRKQKLR